MRIEKELRYRSSLHKNLKRVSIKNALKDTLFVFIIYDFYEYQPSGRTTPPSLGLGD